MKPPRPPVSAFFLAGWLMAPAVSLRAEELVCTIESDSLKVAFDPQTAAFAVTDKRTGYIWRQMVPARDVFTTGKVSSTPDKITAEIRGTLPLRVEISLRQEKPSEVAVFLHAAPAGKFPVKNLTASLGQALPDNEIAYPYPFVSEPGRACTLTGAPPGLMLPITDKGPEGGGGGEAEGAAARTGYIRSNSTDKSYSWFGLVRGEAGYACHVNTPADSVLRSNRFETEDGAEIHVLQPCWVSEKGAWGYDRQATYLFQDRGGHVALAKWARAKLQDAGYLVTLADKIKKTPAVKKLAGAPIVWLWFSGRNDAAMIREMKQMGIERATICFDPNHAAYPSREMVAAINDAGYTQGIYNLFKNQFDLDHPAVRHALPLDSRLHWKQGDWRKHIIRLPDGGLFNWREDATARGQAVAMYVISAHHFLDTLEQDVAEELALYPRLTVRLLDTWAANFLREDYSPDHPHNRRFDAAQRAKLVDTLAVKHGSVVGSENYSTWFLPVGHYSEGAMSLGRYRFAEPAGTDAGRAVPAVNLQDNFGGLLLDHQLPRPSMMKYVFEPTYRVPLGELVAHDVIVSTHHWRDSNHHWGPEAWDYNDLWDILYGALPLWNLDSFEWNHYKERFVRCYRDVCAWHEKVFGAEMIDHRFLTSDRLVQQTRFSNGWAVTVNFNKTDSYDDEGRVVPPMGHRTFQWESTPP